MEEQGNELPPYSTKRFKSFECANFILCLNGPCYDGYKQ